MLENWTVEKRPISGSEVEHRETERKYQPGLAHHTEPPCASNVSKFSITLSAKLMEERKRSRDLVRLCKNLIRPYRISCNSFLQTSASGCVRKIRFKYDIFACNLFLPAMSNIAAQFLVKLAGRRNAYRYCPNHARRKMALFKGVASQAHPCETLEYFNGAKQELATLPSRLRRISFAELWKPQAIW